MTGEGAGRGHGPAWHGGGEAASSHQGEPLGQCEGCRPGSQMAGARGLVGICPGRVVWGPGRGRHSETSWGVGRKGRAQE